MAYFSVDGYNSYSGCDITVTASLPMINGKQFSKYYTLGSLQTLSISTHQDKRPVRSLGVINAKDYVMGPRTVAGSMVFAVFNRHFASEIMADLGATGSDVILPDEIPALNITVNFANEYGRMSRMAIYGVKIINEGQVMSINDLYTENTYQFVALGLEPLNVELNSDNSAGSLSSPTNGEYKAPEIQFVDDSQDVKASLNNNFQSIGDLSNIVDNINNIVNGLNPLGTTTPNGNNSAVDIPSKDLANEIKNYNPTGALINDSTGLTDEVILNHLIDNNVILQANSTDEVVRFLIIPEQDSGRILIGKEDNRDDEDNGAGTDLNNKYDYLLDLANKRSYNISLPPGNYIAQYESPLHEYSNEVYFTVQNNNSQQNEKLEDISYPFIDKVGSDYIMASSGNHSHDTLSYSLEGGLAQQKNIGKKTITVNDLENNSEYSFYTNKTMTRSLPSNSKILTLKTHDENSTAYDLFLEFIDYNKNLILTSYENIKDMLTGYNYDDYLSLIDLVLSLPECNEKQELLIFANILNKQLIDSYNQSNDNIINLKIQKNYFDPVISITGYPRVGCYFFDNFKSSLIKTFNPQKESFYAKTNKHYCVQAIKDNVRTVKYDFAVCNPSSYDVLKKYCDTDKYKNISLDHYLDKYTSYNYETIQLIAIKDNCQYEQKILDEPYIYEEDNEIFADIDYFVLNDKEEYYLVCSNIYEAMDYIPKRKIKFTNKTKKLNLNHYYLGLNKKNVYMFWIENSDFIKISKPFIFTHLSNPQHKQLTDIYDRDLSDALFNLSKELINSTGHRTLVNDLSSYIYSLNPAMKNLQRTVYCEFIRYFENSNYVSNVFSSLFNLIKLTHSKREIQSSKLKIEINPNNKHVVMTYDSSYSPCAIYFDSETSYRLNNVNEFYCGDEGYTLLYFTHNKVFHQTDFILIENKTGLYLVTDNMLPYVKKVGDRN